MSRNQKEKPKRREDEYNDALDKLRAQAILREHFPHAGMANRLRAIETATKGERARVQLTPFLDKVVKQDLQNNPRVKRFFFADRKGGVELVWESSAGLYHRILLYFSSDLTELHFKAGGSDPESPNPDAPYHYENVIGLHEGSYLYWKQRLEKLIHLVLKEGLTEDYPWSADAD